MEYELTDTGHRELSATGVARERAPGKGRFDLLPPFALKRLAILFEKGANKYREDELNKNPFNAGRQWEQGYQAHWYLDSALRHIFRFLECRILGKPQDEDNLAAAAWNILCLIDTLERIKRGLLPREIDDLPNPDISSESTTQGQKEYCK